MLSETLDKTANMNNWQIFSKKLFQHFIYHKKNIKITKFKFKIICRSRVLDKNIPLWYIVPPLPTPRVLIGLRLFVDECSPCGTSITGDIKI